MRGRMPDHRAPEDAQLALRRQLLFEHRQALRDAGYDPDFIGVTEIKPVCCQGCGKPIPWRTLRGWQD